MGGDDAGSIAVVRALHGLGDMLCAVPALRSLRHRWPNADITLVGVPRARWLHHRFPWLIDRWIDLPHWPGIPEAEGEPAEVIALLTAPRPLFDLAVQLHGSGGTINGFTRSLGARRLAGHHQADEVPLDGTFVPWAEHGHEIERMLAVVGALGCPTDDTRLEMPEHTTDIDDTVVGVLARHAPASYAVLHPGASRPDRRWDPAGFAAVVDHLADAGLGVVLTGSAEERCLARRVAEHCVRVRPTIVAGDLTLGGLAAVVRRARAVVVNDTGVAHLAVACGTPTVVVGTTSDLPRWAPIDRVRHGAVQTSGEPSTDRAAVLAEADRVLGR